MLLTWACKKLSCIICSMDRYTCLSLSCGILTFMLLSLFWKTAVMTDGLLQFYFIFSNCTPFLLGFQFLLHWASPALLYFFVFRLKFNHGNFRIEIPASDVPIISHSGPSIPKDLIEHKAYSLWESKGRPRSSPLQQKVV